MLADLIDDAIKAQECGDGKGLERALRNLAHVGVDRRTAYVMMKARKEDLLEKQRKVGE